MDQIEENKKELLETIKKYGGMPVRPNRSAFLANCWAAYNALCMICDGEDLEAVLHEGDVHDGCDEKPLTKDQVIHWVASMENADGTHGGHWAMEQTEQVREKRGIDCDPLMFYATMNMMYSDYCKVAEKVNANIVDFCACMAKAFLDDKDAKPNKLARYWEYIAGAGEAVRA